MTVETPTHTERFLLFDNFHLPDVAMTGDASHAFGNMNTMVEIGVIRKFMHFDPLHGLAGSVTFPNREELFALRKNERVAVHAGLCWRYY